jgi:O-methyltransferase
MADSKKVVMLEFIKNIFSRNNSESKIPPAEWQLEIINGVGKYTMTSPGNILALINSIKYVIQNNIQGEIVECGVWNGGSMMAAAQTLLALNNIKRKLYLYDTFDDFSTPEEMDISYDGIHGSEVLKKLSSNGNIWRAPDENTVKNNLRQTGYPEELILFIKGKVENTIPETIPEKIALLRLDTDWYASTKHELEWLFPRLSKGGVLIIDDYGYWKGCKKAVDEYFKDHKIGTSLVDIDFSAKLMYKE